MSLGPNDGLPHLCQMRFTLRCKIVAALLAPLLWLAVTPAAQASGFGNRHVIILGVDGCRSDALLVANAPNLKALAASGTATYNAYAGGVLGTPMQQPTVSAPGWASILTGVWTDKHQVTENTFTGYDFTNYPICFQRLKEFNPSAYLASIVEWAPVDTYLVGPVDAYTASRQLAIDNTTTNLIQRAVDLVTTAAPDLLYLHFHQVDSAGHGSGFSPANPAYLAAIERVDTGIGSLLNALPTRPNYTNESWLIIAVTDHGGTGTSHGGQTAAERTTWVIVSGGDAPERVIDPGPGQTCVASTVYAFLGVPIRAEWGLVSAPFGVPLTNGLASYLSFDNTLAAQGGTTNGGAVYGSPPGATARYTAGLVGQAARFSNTGGSESPDDWAVTLGNLDWVYSNNFSVSLWLRSTSSAPAAIFANKSLASASSTGFAIGTTDGANVTWNTDGGSPRTVDFHPPLLDGGWHSVTMTFNRGANEVTTYLDGVAQSTTNLSASGLAVIGSGLPTLIGAGGDGLFACAADVDELGIWSRVLAPAEVGELFAKARAGKGIADLYAPPPVITAQPVSRTVMQSSPAQFSVTAYGTALTYHWQFEGANLAGATNATLLLPSVQFSQAGHYSVVVANAAGSVTSAVAVLTVKVPPPGATTLTVDLVGYYSFESQTDGVVSNAVRAAGFPGFAQDEAILNGAEADTSALMPPFTTNLAKVRAGTGALDCDGVGDYGDIVGNPVVIGQDWSVAAWFKPDTGGASYSGSARAFVFETAGTVYPISFGLRAGTPGNCNFQLFSDYASGTDPSRDYQVANTNVDRWHNLVIVYRAASAVIEGWLDGALTHQIALTASLSPSTAGFHLGTYRTANDRWFKGQMDEVAMWQRAVSPAEVTNLFVTGQAGVTLATRIGQPEGVSLKNNLTGYYPFDSRTNWVVANGAVAVGGTGFANDTLTMMGGAADPSALVYPITHSPTLARAGQGALLGDGMNNYAHLNGNPMDLSQDWSVAAWFKPDTGGLGITGSVRSFIFETAGSTYPISFGLRAGADTNSTLFQFYTQTTSTSTSQDAVVQNSQVDQWHQIILTYDAALGALVGYLDGAETYSLALGPGTALQSYTGFNLGTYRTADGRWFKGLIDEVAFWQRKLDSGEVAQLLSLGNAGASVLTSASTIQSFATNSTPAGSFTLTWRGAPGLKYSIEASSDLRSWPDTVVTNYIAPAETMSLVISPVQPPPTNGCYDPALGSAPQRFYRVKWNP
jgi:hypothetical protein